ncbi:ATP-binding cassette domain-containing protein [Streptomyces sp. 3MP-14]|uniref:ATP-binding cassette domain-containing protein n=1 Tax=Streptomyces mimosae TaxID=2586635 RepID=A0A5N6A5E7_9ACTN|nr:MULTISPECIES: ABC transporter ATP-binding protein [Streptomyces]KAB8163881.1 ATP-binding cassette domain-containing protein [Streptomyces mimosae]KAB8175324.1 ATP-binding cassette domain-containing protein [Streptomyces sp. 3MP-14]
MINKIAEGGSPGDQPAVRASGLRVTRGRREVLRGLDFAVPAGSVTGLLGPSGCGKTTLMRAIVGAQSRVTGTLEVLGEPAGAPALRPRLGYVTQAPSVYADLTVRGNLDYFAAVLGLPRAERPREVERVLDEVDLARHATALTRDLSGGQRSRVSLAAALLGTPELLVLDEPTVGLDPVLRNALWQLFHRLAEERGTTLLISSHVMDEADRCERLVLMREGRVLADGTPEALRRRGGADSVEGAFLALVAADSDNERGAAGPADPDHEREPRR